MQVSKQKQKREYITLANAADCCCYSQEYLSLRARSGKLKAEKLGRNWHTTKEWLKEYLDANGKEFCSNEISARFNKKQNSEKVSSAEFYKRHSLEFSEKFAFGLAAFLIAINFLVFSGRRNTADSKSRKVEIAAEFSQAKSPVLENKTFSSSSGIQADISNGIKKEVQGIKRDFANLALYLRSAKDSTVNFYDFPKKSAKFLSCSMLGLKEIAEDGAGFIKATGKMLLSFPENNKNASIQK